MSLPIVNIDTVVSTKVVSQLHKIARAAKSRAAMTIGIMGSNSLALLG